MDLLRGGNCEVKLSSILTGFCVEKPEGSEALVSRRNEQPGTIGWHDGTVSGVRTRYP